MENLRYAGAEEGRQGSVRIRMAMLLRLCFGEAVKVDFLGAG